MKKSTIIRFLLTAFLIVGVWYNSHWTVALSITLLAMASEIYGYVLKDK